MTTKTPTGEAEPVAYSGDPIALRMPDEATIALWANAFFRAMPGTEGVGAASPQGVGLASAPPQAVGLTPQTPPPPSMGGAGFSPTGIAPESLPLQSVPAAGYAGAEMPAPNSAVAGFPVGAPAAPVTSPSLGGAGFSPTGISPGDLPLQSVPAGSHPDAPAPSPTAAALPGGVAETPVTSPSLDGLGFSPTEISPAPLAQLQGFPAGFSPLHDYGTDLYVVAEAQARQFGGNDSIRETDWLTRPDLFPGTEPLFVKPGVPAAPSSPAYAPATTFDNRDVPIVVSGGHPAFDVQAIRRDFPILRERVHGRPLIWLDNGATTQKPRAVIDRISYFYEHENSNVHRGAHTLAARATDAYENARKIVARFLGASSSDEIVFVRGATEGINLVAQAWGRKNVGKGDEILISHLEHHANIVPWQQLAVEKGAHLRVIPVDSQGQILLSEYERLLCDRTKIVAITHVSNALGTVVPVEVVTARAHAAGAKVLIDGAQSVAHAPVNMQAIDADFFVFSGHKIFAPTGIGVLYGKRHLLNSMPPWQGGGSMIADVTFENTIYQDAPARFEAGTGNLADAVGLGTALEYLERIGMENIARYEHDLLGYATAALLSVPGLKIIGTAPEKASVLSFVMDGLTPEQVSSGLDQCGIAVRAGHHCAQPILRRYGLEGTVRATLALYNTQEDIDCLIHALRQMSMTQAGTVL